MKNKNRKKSIIIAIVVVVLCLVGYKIADKVSYPLVRAKAVLYLADKYDAKISDFEMTDYIHSRFIIEDENPYDLKFKPKLSLNTKTGSLLSTDIKANFMTIISLKILKNGAPIG